MRRRNLEVAICDFKSRTFFDTKERLLWLLYKEKPVTTKRNHLEAAAESQAVHYRIFMSSSSKSSALQISLIPSERVERLILLIRGQKVMLDSDLAEMYGVETKAIVRAVKRNNERFPEDFTFSLSEDESKSLRYQFGTSKKGRGGRRYKPYVFTEQGVAMLSSVLRSKRAVQVNIEIMRAFVRLRQLIGSHEALSKKLDALEKKYADHDQKIAVVFDAIRQLMEPPVSKKRRKIGFRLD